MIKIPLRRGAVMASVVQLVTCVNAAEEPAGSATPPSQAGAQRHLNWIATPKDWCSTEWEAVETATNKVTGLGAAQALHRYTELGDGLNYLDGGVWRKSRDVIEATPDGAAALHGPTKVYFANNLNREGAVTIVTRSNQVLRLRPVGLFYYDAQSGESVQIAAVRDCKGEILPPNRLVYRSAFDSLRADIRYTWSKGAFESDLILLQQPKPPEAYRLNSQTTRLEFWHVFGDDPQPRKTPVVLEGESDPVLRATMVEPDLIDEALDFGDLWFPSGYAFSLGGSEKVSTNVVLPRLNLPTEEAPDKVPVAKRVVRMSDRTGMVEGVPWGRVRPQIQKLPPADSQAQLLGPQPASRKGRVLARLPETASVRGAPMQLALAPYDPAGFCIDYTTVSGNDSYTFNANSTYYIDSGLTFSGTVTFNEGAVIKYADNTYLTLSGYVRCYGSQSNPTVLTSKHEDIFGEPISGSSGNPTTALAGCPALSLYWCQENTTLSQMRIRWATKAVVANDNLNYSRTYTLADSALERCDRGITVANCGFVIQNSTKCSVRSDVYFDPGNATVSGALSDACATDLYSVVATNTPGGVRSANAVLTILPFVTLHPRSQVAYAGGHVIFTAQGDGSPPLSYQWRRNGTGIAGATRSSLTLVNLQTANAGAYSAVISNAGGQAVSTEAALRVNADADADRDGIIDAGALSVTIARPAANNPVP